MKVLILDDNELNLLLAKTILENNSIDVCSADSGAEALKQLEANGDISVALIDLRLGDMSGYELVKLIRKRPEWDHIVLTAFSASALTTEIEKAMKSGFAAYISKPISVSEFPVQIKNLMEKGKLK